MAAESLRTLNPGYFALVMATGIVSVGVRHHGLRSLSEVLLWVAAVSYVVLVGLLVWRVAAFASEVRHDIGDPRRGFGFFAFVAGTNVLGTRLALDGQHVVALALLAVGLLAWLILGYLVPWTAVLARSQRPVLAEANGTWFIWVVASQSIAVLAATLQPAADFGHRELALIAIFSWSVGMFLYAAQGVFVGARLLLYPLRPADLTPPYWVSMGATAITVLAGARILQMTDTPFSIAVRELTASISVVFWAFGTWLFPALVAAGWWRHVTYRVPLRYEATLWSVVFPLGMYGVSGHYLGLADELPIVRVIGENVTWLALAAWAVTFGAMLARLARSWLASP